MTDRTGLIYDRWLAIDHETVRKGNFYGPERIGSIWALGDGPIGKPPDLGIKLQLVRDAIFCLARWQEGV